MADLTYGSLTTLAASPWLVKKFALVQSATAGGTLPHGEGRTPDIIWAVEGDTGGTITAAEVAVVSADSTDIHIDCEDNSGKLFSVYCIWFSQASGGLTNVS